MSILNQVGLNNEYVKMRFNEPYVTAGLNRKDFGTVLRGVYTGFVIGPRAGFTRQITVGPGSVSGGIGTGLISPGYVSGNYDLSLGHSIAVHQSSNGFATTIAIPPGVNENTYLDATGLENQRVYIVLNVSYGISIQTTAQLMLVNAAELNGDPSLMVLGYCDVPASPSTPLDASMFGYTDPQYPRISPLATLQRAGYMSPDQVAKLDQIFPWQDLLAVTKDPNSGLVLNITPSQKVVGGKRIYAYVDSQNTSRFPRNVSGDYNGGVNNDAITTLNISTGIIGGAHGVSGNASFSVASVSGTADSFQMGVVGINADDEISVQYGTVQSVRADAFKDQNLPVLASSFMQLAHFLVETDGSGAIKPIANDGILWRRPFLNLGGGGGASSRVVNIARGYANGTNLQACAISEVSSKTRVVVSGFTYIPNINPGKTQGGVVVRVNGQTIERKVAGVNDFEGMVVYEEVGLGGTTVDVYEIVGGSPTPIDGEAPVEIELIQYGAQDLGAVSTDILPDATATRDIGGPSRVWKEVWVDDSSIHFVTNASEYGTLRRNAATKQLEYRSTPSGQFLPLGGGSAGEMNAMLQALYNAENSIAQPVFFNELIDTHATSKGTIVNATISGSKLSLNPGQISGSQEITKEVSEVISSMLTVTEIAAQALAPKATAIISNTIVFDGDVTEFFPTAKNVLIAKELTSDGSLVHQYLTDSLNRPALLTVNSATFSSGANETSIVLANPNSLDLDLNVSAVNYPTNLRVIPFDYAVKLKSDTGASAQSATLVSAQTTGTLRIPAEVLDAFTLRAGTLTGSVIRKALGASPNGTYLFAVVLEHQAANAYTYHFYSSADSGNTFTKAAYTEANASGGSLTEDENYGYFQDPQIVVADNGKAFATFTNSESNTWAVKGVYSDLSVGVPVVTQSPATGVDGINSTGTAGFISRIVNQYRVAQLAADLTDLSFVCVAISSPTTDDLNLRFYTNGGATYQNSDLGGFAHTGGSKVGLTVTGSGSAHRVFVFGKNSSTTLTYRYWDQPSATSVGNGTALTGDFFVYDTTADATKGYCLVRDNSDDAPKYFSWNVTGSPTFSGLKVLSSQLDLTETIGLENIGSYGNYHRNVGKRVIISPASSNNVFFACDLSHQDGVERGSVIEVRDDTSFAGTTVSMLTENNNFALRNTSSKQKIAQTFTASSTRLRSVTLKAHGYSPTGVPIASGATLTAHLYNTSGGLPTTLVASALNSYDPAHLPQTTTTIASDRRLIAFNFNTQTLTGTYAIVLESTIAINGVTDIRFGGAASVYAGGDLVEFDGTTWSISTGNDLTFEINGEWNYDLSGPAAERTKLSGVKFWSTDSAIGLASASLVSVTTKVSPTGLSAAQRRQAGHTYKAQLSIGSGANASSFVLPPSPAGYSPTQFDKALVYNTQCGTVASGRKDSITGVVHATERAEDRSGLNIPVSSYNNLTTVTDGDFSSGQASEFNGTNSNVAIVATDPMKLIGVNPIFAIELEIKPLAFGSSRGILNWASTTTTSGGWVINYSTSGTVFFAVPGGATTETSSTMTLNTRALLKIVGDGQAIRIYFNGVEQPYATQITSGYTFAAPNTGNTIITLGAYSDNANNLNARFGTVRMVRGTTTFASALYYSQPETLSPINAGRLVGLNQGIGTGSETIGTGFNQFGTAPVSGGSTSVVNSYGGMFLWELRPVATPGRNIVYRNEFGRGSNRNNSALYGNITRGFKV